jgi:diadenosine tetraphosphatase ApaH/serine/threonine PP2A family protein phosphatase
MLLGLVSDPHANLPALEAVLVDIERVRPDAVVCLGDFVGYGASPNEVVDALKERCAVSLVGNHDLAALAQVDLKIFNPHAAAAARWTAAHLAAGTAEFLRGLPSRALFEGLLVAHASPRDPIWEYVMDSSTAAANFETEEFEICFVGHTHVPAVFWTAPEGVSGMQVVVPDEGVQALDLPPGRLLLNPGGVGQPRDGDPRASWATWDTDARTFSVRRLPYRVEDAQKAILASGLPEVLAERLAEGW